jgi:hypothetical protein
MNKQNILTAVLVFGVVFYAYKYNKATGSWY